MELTLLLFIPAIASFIWPMIMFLKKDKIIMPQYIMAIAQVLSGFCLIFYISYYNDLISSHIIADMLYVTSMAFLMPMFYMFICSLTTKGGITRRQRLFFLPSIIFVGITFLLLIILGPQRYAYYMDNVLVDGNFVLLPSLAYRLEVIIGFFGFRIFIVAQYLYLMIKGIAKMHRYYKALNLYCTTNENLQKSCYHHVNIFAWVAISITLILLLLPYQYVVETNLGLTYIGILLMSATQIFLGQYAYYITYSVDQLSMMTDEKTNHLQNLKS